MNINEKKVLVEQWYYRYAKLLFHAACLLDTPDAAEEVVQETFRIVMGMDDLDKVEYPKTWLRKITYNAVRNRRRGESRIESVSLSEDESSLAKLGGREDEPNLELEYGGIISSEDLRLLRLSIIEGRTYAEIAEELGISVKACQKRAERAKKEMRKKLETD